MCEQGRLERFFKIICHDLDVRVVLLVVTVLFVPAVQHECIPQAILGMDVLCQAKSGMGKTAVFVLSVLQQLEPVDGEVGAIVICHTRELAYQVRTIALKFGFKFGVAYLDV